MQIVLNAESVYFIVLYCCCRMCICLVCSKQLKVLWPEYVNNSITVNYSTVGQSWVIIKLNYCLSAYLSVFDAPLSKSFLSFWIIFSFFITEQEHLHKNVHSILQYTTVKRIVAKQINKKRIQINHINYPGNNFKWLN